MSDSTSTIQQELCMHCNEKIVPLFRGLGDKPVCTLCAVKRLHLLVVLIKEGFKEGFKKGYKVGFKEGFKR